MTKEVRKAIMIRSILRNTSLKDKNEKSKNDYGKQCNLCDAFVRIARQQYFSSLDLSLIADNKNFWKIVRPFLSDKISHRDVMSLEKSSQKVIPASSLLTKKNGESRVSQFSFRICFIE